jgi:oxygen-independent coproporphyrinogen-3 oxidase
MLELAVVPAASELPDRLPIAAVDGLYVHVPFCFHKCHYCDFYSITRQTPQRMQQFVERTLREAQQWSNDARGPNVRPTTIFFGGGTPSLLPLEFMEKLLVGLREQFDLSALQEWTVEANPATVTLDYCRMLREHGVDRLSFGAQSFRPSELALLERHHNPDDVPRSVEIARTAGFTRLNVDLIFAIPGQDLASWSQSLEAAIALNTPHISCYALTYEPNTAMAVRRRLGQFQAVDENVELQMLHFTRDRLREIGRPPYEVSNFATPGEECRHNLNYWTGGNYLGIGPSAASHVQGWRWKNRPHLGEWESAIDAGRLPASEVEHLTPPRRAGELAMLMLRLERGLDFADFSARSGYDARIVYAEVFDRLTGPGLIEVTATTCQLTRAGLNVADAVAAEFLSSPLAA